MKKNKTVAYMLAATLLVGGTFLGTKALFTDKVDTVGELSISTGDVDIDADVTQDWHIEHNGKELDTGTSNDGRLAQFENLKYGDVLTKEVKITNKGTLNALVNFEENKEITSKLPDGIAYTVRIVDGKQLKKDTLVEPGKSSTIEFKLEVVKGGQHNENGSFNSDKQEETIIDLNDSYTLTAQQQNPKNKQDKN